MSIVARLEENRLDPEVELGALISRARGEGAVVSFVGLARPRSTADNPVDELVLETHPSLTLRSLEAIARSAAERFGVSEVHVVHRCGSVAPGEAIVFAGAASAHRRAAFDAADYLMDRLKTEAMFWKREISGGRSQWIEPTDDDYARKDRWD